MQKIRSTWNHLFICIFYSRESSFPCTKGCSIHSAPQPGEGFCERLQPYLTPMAPQVPKGQHILHVCSAYFNRWRISPIFQWNSVSDCRNHASSTFQPDLQTVLHTEKRRQVEKQLNKQRSLGIKNKAKPRGSDSN